MGKGNPRKVIERKKNLSGRPRFARSKDGVDVTLIDWMLLLTPVERLKVAQENANAILRLRRANPGLSFPTPDAAKNSD